MIDFECCICHQMKPSGVMRAHFTKDSCGHICPECYLKYQEENRKAIHEWVNGWFK